MRILKKRGGNRGDGAIALTDPLSLSLSPAGNRNPCLKDT